MSPEEKEEAVLQQIAQPANPPKTILTDINNWLNSGPNQTLWPSTNAKK